MTIVLKICRGVIESAWLNVMLLVKWLQGRPIIIFQMNTPRQFMHIAPVFDELKRTDQDSTCYVFLLNPSHVVEFRSWISDEPSTIHIASIHCSPLLLFWDAIVTIEQRMRFPLLRLGRPIICMFHGQPSKGNPYINFAYKSINHLFLYGPLMKDYFEREKEKHPEWPHIELHEIGQPKSDSAFTEDIGKATARRRLGLDPDKTTIIYAPSFESCSSLNTDGLAIIDHLRSKDMNVILRPHPSTYTWREGIERDWNSILLNYENGPHFCHHQEPDLTPALRASDIMLTDYSGVAFDAITMDLPVIFWECRSFFFDYAPKVYGRPGNEILGDLACNAGRDAGRVVSSLEELDECIEAYREDPTADRAKRKAVRSQLFYNPGRATATFTQQLRALL